MDLVGKVLANRYQIVEQLGGGGMAVVYRAKCTFLNRDVTVKVLRPEYTSDEDFVNRFRREAQSVASLSHGNIVNVYDVGHEGHIHYIVMEYVEGSNLKELIREHGSIPVRDAVEIAKQICDGLDHAHENNIIHRDIKPHNILITKTGRVKVTDFGIARAATSSTVTHTGTIVGSVHYFSPEQAKGEATGVRSDIYSLGVVLYEMLTGKVPFEGESPIAIALKQIQEGATRPLEIKSDIPLNVEKIVMRAMAKNPAQRYQSAKEMRYDLDHVFSGELSDSTKNIDADEFATQILQAGSLGKIPKVIRNDTEPAKNDPERKIKPWAIILVLAALLGLGLGVFVAFNSFMRGEEVAVPKVVGEKEDIAKVMLADKGLKMKVREYRYSDKEEGIVLFQSEEADKIVKKNREISVDVSKGTEKVKVPALKGQTREEARATLSNLGLLLGKVEFEYSDEVDKDFVTRQDPAEEEEVTKAEAISIWLSKGPEPKQVNVPNVVGLTVDEARKVLVAAGLILDGNYPYEESYEQPEGYIISQVPVSGAQQAEEGSTVEVVVSKGPGPEEKSTAFQLTVPFDGATHKVEAKVVDARDPGGRLTYSETHNPGDVVAINVSYVGQGYLQVYVDGKVFGERKELK